MEYSVVHRRGDFLSYPKDSSQKENLLKIKVIAGKKVSSSLPNSSREHKGLIRGLPVEEFMEEIRLALAHQGVTDLYRIRNREGDSPTDRIILTFNTKPPVRVKMFLLSFEVQPLFPNPYHCRRCCKIGHTHNLLRLKTR